MQVAHELDHVKNGSLCVSSICHDFSAGEVEIPELLM